MGDGRSRPRSAKRATRWNWRCPSWHSTLYLRNHPQARDNYRVILKAGESEIGSIGIQHGAAWRWGIDTVIPDARSGDAGGRQGSQGLHAAFQGWGRFVADEANLTDS
jgi:hypothetical protein